MTRIARSALDDGLYHAYARGVYQQTIYRDEHDYQTFLWLLGRTEREVRWHIHVVCLMPTHFHVVLETTVTDLSRGMHRLNGVYAQRFNRRYDRWGHVFASRFGCRLIETEEYFDTVCRYVLDNPVRAGHCETADEWPWSIRWLNRSLSLEISRGRADERLSSRDTSEGLALGPVSP